MHLISKNKITVNNGINSTEDVFLIGKLYSEQINIENSMDVLFQYAYLNAEDAKIIETKTFAVTEEEQQAMYQAVKGNLPDINVSYSAWYKALIFEAFRVQMATTFGIPIEDISIVA